MIETFGHLQAVVRFGHGDIGQASAWAKIDNKEHIAIAYYQIEPQKIGSMTKDNRPVQDIMTSAPVVFMFANIKSLDIVIQNLRHIKKDYLQYQKSNLVKPEGVK